MLGAARSLVRIADYRRLWAIGGLSGVCRWLEFVAVAIFAFELTRSPELVALITVLRMLPYVALGFFAGAVADAVDRRAFMIFAVVVMGGVSAAMAGLAATGSAGYWAVAAATMVSGAFWTTDMPVRRRLLVDAAGQGQIPAALGLDNSTTYATRAIGPLLGGVAYGLVGISGIYAVIALSYAVCLVLALRLSSPAAPEGAAATFDWRRLLPPRELVLERRFLVILGVTLVYNLWCFPFVTMVPVIAQRDFGLVPALVGALAACDGIGGTLGALLVGMVASDRTLFRFYYLGPLVFLVLVLALSQWLVVGFSIPVLILLGIAQAAFSATQYALIYVMSPPEMRGRATGVLSIFIGSSMLGHYHAGILFERLGSAKAMSVMALEGIAVMLVLGMIWMWRSKPRADDRGAPWT